MQEPDCHEKYPFGIVVVANLVSVLIYGIGAFILYQFGIIWVIIYLLFILFLEFRLMSSHCTDCCYFGKRCAFGKGYLSSLFFHQGNPALFRDKKISWFDVLPDFLVFIIPVLAGILLLINDFSSIILGCVISLLLLGFAGNAFVRARLACRYCRQREIGCPAQEMFNVKNR
ncbi:MAG: hypothetical protein LUQ54_05825 [Methanoregula sp.]|nr:hypothetical protein [Methanoregula sp.]